MYEAFVYKLLRKKQRREFTKIGRRLAKKHHWYEIVDRLTEGKILYEV